jgi:hypothetical protein
MVTVSRKLADRQRNRSLRRLMPVSATVLSPERASALIAPSALKMKCGSSWARSGATCCCSAPVQVQVVGLRALVRAPARRPLPWRPSTGEVPVIGRTR